MVRVRLVGKRAVRVCARGSQIGTGVRSPLLVWYNSTVTEPSSSAFQAAWQQVQHGSLGGVRPAQPLQHP